MSTIVDWLRTAERWLDDRGRGAWIATMIVGFILFWPIGLAILAYMIWSNRMKKFFNRRNCRGKSGNSAFDAYRAETLKRLESEQKAFQDFLSRLREAKDKAEFEQFLNERKGGNSTAA